MMYNTIGLFPLCNSPVFRKRIIATPAIVRHWRARPYYEPGSDGHKINDIHRFVVLEHLSRLSMNH